MSKVTGQVFKLYEKNLGRKILWSFRLENDPVYYRMDENRGAGIVEPGNFVEFEAELNFDGKSAQVKEPPRRVEPAKAPAAASGANYSRGGDPSREQSIHYQSARKDALLLMQIALANGAIALPAKQGAKLAALEALVDSYTALYLEDISTGGAVTRATERAYADEQGEAEPTPQPKAKKSAAKPGARGPAIEADEDDGFEGEDD